MRGRKRHAVRDVVRALLEDRAALVLRQRPPGGRLPDRDQRGARRLGTAERRRHRVELRLLRTLDVARVPGDARQTPDAAGGRGDARRGPPAARRRAAARPRRRCCGRSARARSAPPMKVAGNMPIGYAVMTRASCHRAAPPASPAGRGTTGNARPPRAATPARAASSRPTSMVSTVIAPFASRRRQPPTTRPSTTTMWFATTSGRAVSIPATPRRQRRRVIAVGDDELVVVREQVNGGATGARLRGRRAGREPERLAVDARRTRAAGDAASIAAARVAHRQPRPPGEVAGQRRPVAGEVAARQLGQRLVARRASGRPAARSSSSA